MGEDSHRRLRAGEAGGERAETQPFGGPHHAAAAGHDRYDGAASDAGRDRPVLNDKSANAWAKVVDRLLASPAYGERWARHWLDVARYADSNGFKADETRPQYWRYRDYVINAFNGDKPYDRFVKEQVAGDELYPGDPDALAAMGFNRNWIDETNAAALVCPQAGNSGRHDHSHRRGVHGPDYGCARCHNHKFDPIFRRIITGSRRFSPTPVSATARCPIKDAV